MINQSLIAPLVLLFGAMAGIGLFAVVMGWKKVPPPQASEAKPLLSRQFTFKGSRAEQSRQFNAYVVQAVLAASFAVSAWLFTGWPAAILIGALSGWGGPVMARAPKKRDRMTDEIEAYSQWTEQIRDLVSASGSLFEAVTLSADNAPKVLRPSVTQMANMARTVGLTPALDWFAAEMSSPFADRLVLGMKIAWDSGARVSEAFESVARGMRAEVEMRRRNEVANSRAWTQVLSMVGVTVVSVLLMFIVNKGFFDPFGTLTGQGILLAVAAMIFGCVFWVLKLSESGMPMRLISNEALMASQVAAVSQTEPRGS